MAERFGYPFCAERESEGMMKKLMMTSKVFGGETVKALNDATAKTSEAQAMACMDAVKVGVSRDAFLVEMRKVTRLPMNTAAASAGLRAAKEEKASVASVALAIEEQYDKDRLGHKARRAAAKNKGQPPAGQPPAGQPPAGQPPAGQPPAGQPPAGQPPAGQPPAGQPPAGQPPAGEPPAGEFEKLTLAQLEAVRDQLEKRLATVRGLIANMRKNETPVMGDAAAVGC